MTVHPDSRRGENGRFSTSYPTMASLLQAIAKVARVACPHHPAGCTQEMFDTMRPFAGCPKLPTARRLCARMGRDGSPKRWSEVLEDALDAVTSPVQLDVAVKRSEEAPHLTKRHVVFALRLVATDRDAVTLTPGEYRAGRALLLASDARRQAGGLLKELLPTEGQVERIAEAEGVARNAAWDWALDVAGLEPRPILAGAAAATPIGMPRGEAIAWFVRTCNYRYRPTLHWLERWAKEAHISLARRTQLFGGHLKEAADLLANEGREMPTATPPPGARIDFTFPDDGVPGANPPRPAPTRWTGNQVVSQMRLFVVAHPDGGQREYQAWAKGHPERPHTNVLNTYGGLDALRELAVQLNRDGIPTPDDPLAATSASSISSSDRNAAMQQHDATGAAAAAADTEDEIDVVDAVDAPVGAMALKLTRPSAGRQASNVLLHLIDNGTLHAGQTLYLQHSDTRHTAVLIADGLVQLTPDDQPRALSNAARTLLGRSGADGWFYFQAEVDGKLVRLQKLKQARAGETRRTDDQGAADSGEPTASEEAA